MGWPDALCSRFCHFPSRYFRASTFVFRLVCQFCSFRHDAWPKNSKRSLLEKKNANFADFAYPILARDFLPCIWDLSCLNFDLLNTLKKKTRAEGLVHDCLFPLLCLCLCCTGNRHNSLFLILFYSIACSLLIAFVSLHRKQAQ